MPRQYQCPTCLKDAVTESMRGPTPRRCADCTGVPPQNVTQLRSVKGVPDQIRYSAPATVETVLYHDKMALALAMRMDYCDWPEIAAACGYKSEQAAYTAVKTAMSYRMRALDEPLDQIRIREYQRLEKLGRKAMEVLEADHPLVQGGKVVTREVEPAQVDPRTGAVLKPAVCVELEDGGPVLAAIDRLLKLSESRRKLLGLDAAQKVENAVTVQYTVEGIAAEEMP